MNWSEFEQASPSLAEYGRDRFGTGVAYLATVKADGSPRVHPVTPIIGNARLFLFMEPTSPKGDDLRRDGRYALHCSVENSSGGQGEFLIEGTANYTDDPSARSIAIESASYQPTERYILFELGVRRAFSTTYDDEGQAIRTVWSSKPGNTSLR